MRVRLLLIDDYPSISSLMPKLLAARGFDVHVAGTVGEALQLTDQHFYEIVVSETEIGQASVFGLLRMIKDRQPDARTVLYTAHDREVYWQEALRLAVSGFWIKPVSADEMAHRLHVLLAESRNLCKMGELVISESRQSRIEQKEDFGNGRNNRAGYRCTKGYH